MTWVCHARSHYIVYLNTSVSYTFDMKFAFLDCDVLPSNCPEELRFASLRKELADERVRRRLNECEANALAAMRRRLLRADAILRLSLHIAKREFRHPDGAGMKDTVKVLSKAKDVHSRERADLVTALFKCWGAMEMDQRELVGEDDKLLKKIAYRYHHAQIHARTESSSSLLRCITYLPTNHTFLWQSS